MEDINEYIEEKPIFCTYCNDHRYVNSMARNPCPYCNKEEYKEWKEEYEKSLKNIRGKKTND